MNPPIASSELQQLADRIHAGQIILYPTDTVRWIGWDATNIKVIKRIIELKHRSLSKTMICLVHPDWIGRYTSYDVVWSYQKLDQYDVPTTLVVPILLGVLPEEMVREWTIAVRIPWSCDYLMSLLALLGKPLISTSANISWHRTPSRYEDIELSIIRSVDWVAPPSRDTGTHQSSRLIGVDGQVLR